MKDESINELLKATSIVNRKIQELTIGMFKPYGSKTVEMVISRESWGGLHTIHPCTFGGFSETHIPEDKGIYIPFGGGRNLTDMLREPFELDKFYKHFEK